MYAQYPIYKRTHIRLALYSVKLTFTYYQTLPLFSWHSFSIYERARGSAFRTNFAYCLELPHSTEVVLNDFRDAQVGAESFQRPNENPLNVSYLSFFVSFSFVPFFARPIKPLLRRDIIVNVLTAFFPRVKIRNIILVIAKILNSKKVQNNVLL